MFFSIRAFAAIALLLPLISQISAAPADMSLVARGNTCTTHEEATVVCSNGKNSLKKCVSGKWYKAKCPTGYKCSQPSGEAPGCRNPAGNYAAVDTSKWPSDTGSSNGHLVSSSGSSISSGGAGNHGH